MRLPGCGFATAIDRSTEAQLRQVDPFQGDTQADRGGLWYQEGTQLSCVQTETFEKLANPLPPARRPLNKSPSPPLRGRCRRQRGGSPSQGLSGRWRRTPPLSLRDISPRRGGEGIRECFKGLRKGGDGDLIRRSPNGETKSSAARMSGRGDRRRSNACVPGLDAGSPGSTTTRLVRRGADRRCALDNGDQRRTPGNDVGHKRRRRERVATSPGLRPRQLD